MRDFVDDQMPHKKKVKKKGVKKADHKHDFKPCVFEYPTEKFDKQRGMLPTTEESIGSYCTVCGKIGIEPQLFTGVFIGFYFNRSVFVPNSVVFPAFRELRVKIQVVVYLSRSSADHAEELRPTRHTCVASEGTVMQGDHEFLPREDPFKREVLRQSDVLIGQLVVYIDVLSLEAVSNMLHQGFDLFTRPQFSRLNQVNEWLQVGA